jgi:hypothetical protein
MASIPAEIPTASAPKSSLDYPLYTYSAALRVLLFLAVLIYARFRPISSISSVLSHVCVISCLGMIVEHFSGGTITHDHVADLMYAFAMASFPDWSQSHRLLAWVVPQLNG